jgi:hypothetical protein
MEEVNFDYTPTLISQRLYQWTKDTVFHWVDEDSLTNYLVEILPRKACKGGFELVDPQTDEVVPEWEAIDSRLKEIDYYEMALSIFQDARGYRTGVMKLLNQNRFQMIPGHLIVGVDEDSFGEPIKLKVQTTSGIKEHNPQSEKFYYIHLPRRAWLKPIFTPLVLIKWITYSMTEAAAREGAKFVQVKVKGLDDDGLSAIRTKFVGLSNRKLAVTNEQIEEILVHDTKLSATFEIYLEALYKPVANYCLVPIATLFGVQIGAVTGSQVDVGSEYEAYAAIQEQMERYHRLFIPRIMKLYGTQLNMENVKFKWANTQRMSKREEEEVEGIKAQRQAIQCGKPFKTMNEVREENKDDAIAGGDDIEVLTIKPPTIQQGGGGGADEGV